MNTRSTISKRKSVNPSHRAYLNKNTEVCDRWRSFNNFLEDMGKKPSPQHSLDRIDNSKGYSKENCRWASPTEQIDNRDCTNLITANGKTQSLARWANELNVSYEAIRGRFRKGWPHDKIVNFPYKTKKKQHSNKKTYSEEAINQIINWTNGGTSQREIKRMTGFSCVAIARIIKDARNSGKLPPFKG